MAAILDVAPKSVIVDVIEINPVMPAAQRHFDLALPYTQRDRRIHLFVRDGFRHFAKYEGPAYDVVAIDVAWMQNMNATHLFSLETYRNIRRHLRDEGILGVWIEESSPFSPTSLIIYRTLTTNYCRALDSAVIGTHKKAALTRATGLDAPVDLANPTLKAGMGMGRRPANNAHALHEGPGPWRSHCCSRPDRTTSKDGNDLRPAGPRNLRNRGAGTVSISQHGDPDNSTVNPGTLVRPVLREQYAQRNRDAAPILLRTIFRAQTPEPVSHSRVGGAQSCAGGLHAGAVPCRRWLDSGRHLHRVRSANHHPR